METIGVVHLARHKSGLAAFQNFLRSYSQYRAGVSHDLLILYKGFPSRAAVAGWEAAAKTFSHQTMFISDWGFDIRAFRVAAEQAQQRHLFFLNSFSELQADDWLAKPYALMQGEGVGIVGATGSWESMYTNALTDLNWQPTSMARLKGLLRLQACRFCFDPFPNSHLRTNAFMLSRDLMLKVWPRYVLTKRGAYLFENGKNGLTKRILRLGLQPLVVGKDGKGFEIKDWPGSNTFRTLAQDNLLVADNQTRLYQKADAQTRQWLTGRAWGQ